jgi:glycosyltransferase involved in cell wall biosynthesis
MRELPCLSSQRRAYDVDSALQVVGRKKPEAASGAKRPAERTCLEAGIDHMRLLISAYACAPNLGSEHAVGWNWTTEAHRLGHQVWALASPAHREAVEKACHAAPDLRGIHWIFPEVALWPLRPGIEPKWERTYNLFWQRAALCHARQLQQKVELDAIHHLTWGGVRAPTFLGSLGPPLIVGPLGGGETSPRSLRDGFHFKAKVTEAIRDLSNATITINPLVRRGLGNAAVIFVKTPDTRLLLTRRMQQKAIAFIELGLQPPQIGQRRGVRETPPKLLYAGRLLYWKGVHLAIRAFAELVRRLPEVRFTIVGRGPEEGRLKAAAAAYDLQDKINFVSWLPQQQLFELYVSHDLLLFPSLHDSSGGVVLEALAHGLPVVCLDLGGPKEIVTPQSGIIVPTDGRNTVEVAHAVAGEIFRLLTSSASMSALSAGATARAGEFLLSSRVGELYKRVIEVIGSADCGRARPAPR